MEIEEYDFLRHPQTVRLLAEEIIKVCNDHKARRINDKTLQEIILYWATYEGEKLFNGNEFSSSIVKIVGKRRINLLGKLLNGFQPSLYLYQGRNPK